MTKLDAEHRDRILSTHFAFPEQRNEPLEDASHVRNAMARFDQVEGVNDADRDEAGKCSFYIALAQTSRLRQRRIE